MAETKPNFSVVVHMYLWLFLFFLVIAPATAIRATAIHTTISTVWWVFAAMWPGIVAGIFFYARARCASDAMAYKDGLLWVAASMMTGWVQLSFIIVMPTLTFAFFSSLVLALESDLRRDPVTARVKWLSFVRFFYENRLRR